MRREISDESENRDRNQRKGGKEEYEVKKRMKREVKDKKQGERKCA